SSTWWRARSSTARPTSTCCRATPPSTATRCRPTTTRRTVRRATPAPAAAATRARSASSPDRVIFIDPCSRRGDSPHFLRQETVAMATLEEKLEAGTFVITAEVTPPLSASPDALLEAAAPLRGLVDAVNVTDAPGARATMSSFAAAAILAGNGFEPILQTTCRDRNRIAMAGDLLGAAAQGVRNLLVLHGDDPQAGDMPEAKPVYDLDSRGVMALARDMRETGTLPSGREIRPAPHFFIGCADTPFDPPDDFTPAGLEAKIAAGARFAQTQFCFEPQVAGRYFGWLADHGVTARLRIIAGIGPLRSAGQARYM